jgi:hypothetical protein
MLFSKVNLVSILNNTTLMVLTLFLVPSLKVYDSFYGFKQPNQWKLRSRFKKQPNQCKPQSHISDSRLTGCSYTSFLQQKNELGNLISSITATPTDTGADS